LTGGCNNQLFGGGRETKHNNIVLKAGAISRPSDADPAPKHNNKPQRPLIFIANERTRQYTKQNNYQTSNNQPEERWRDLILLLVLLVFIARI
jgi:hypothetical protein